MTEDITQRNRAAYDRIAADFVARNPANPQAMLDAAERMIERIAAFHLGPPRILDLGCGAGRSMAWFEEGGGSIIGADLSIGMLNEAHQRVRGPLVQMDMGFLGFAGRSFNAIWCQAALLHLPKALAPQALAEMARVLSAGGLLVLSVQQGDHEGIETRTYEPAERYYAYYQPQELAELVRAAGFTPLAQGEWQDRRAWLWLEAQINRAE